MKWIAEYDSPVGQLVMVSDGEALTALRFGSPECTPEYQKNGSECLMVDRRQRREHPVFQEVICWLDRYFCGEQPGPVPLLYLHGTDFQKLVWEILLTIPYGRTMTYGDVAKQVASRQGRASMSAQAVGGAAGRNPIAVIVPCHRVIGANGSLTGYAGGLDKKRFLLDLEAQAVVSGRFYENEE